MGALRTLLLSLLLVLILQAGMAGAAFAQSVFALENIGQPIDSNDARMVGRGGWGMAVADSLDPGFLNAASSTSLRHVAIKFTAYGETNNNQDETGTRTTHRTLIPDIRVGLPIIKGRMAFTSGIQVGRSFEFRTLNPMTWYSNNDTIYGNEQFRREGTLWQIPTALSLKVLDNVSIAGTLGLVNGTIRETTDNFFVEPYNGSGNPLFFANRKVLEDEFTGRSTTWSIHADLARGIKVGASWTPAYDLDAERQISMGGLGDRTNSEWTLNMPETYKGGFEAKLSNRWRMGADASLQKFSDFSGDDFWAADMVDEVSMSFGMERDISFERHGGMSNIPLRFGAQYRRWAYQVGGEDVVEKTISLGTGFPFHNKMGMLDAALSYSLIGDESKNGVESQVWRMTVSVTGLEKWW